MTGSESTFRILALLSRSVRVAGASLAAPFLLFTAATAGGESLRLHTPSMASPTSTPFVVSFDGAGQPLPPTAGTFPAGFAAQWQLPATPGPYGLRIAPSLRFAWVGGAAEDAVVLSTEVATALQNGGFLDASGNYTGGAVRSPVAAATATRDGRFLLALDSSSKSAIALLEIGVEAGKPTVRSAVVKTSAALPADTFGVLGAGITLAADLSRGTVVFGDANATYASLYAPGATGSRFSALDTIPNPAGFHYVAATSAGSDGAFWVVGVNGNAYEVRFLDTKTRQWGTVAATIPKLVGDLLLPAFDPYDTGRMLLVVSRVGSTPTWVLTGLTPGTSRGTLAPSAQNGGFDFSTSPNNPPVVLVPASGAARGYLAGRSTGETSERLYAIDLTSGAMSATPIVFGAARHQTLVLEVPAQAPQGLSIRADSSGAVSGGQSATFTVTRTNPSGAFVVRYATQSADGSAIAGRDYDAGSGTVTMPDGSASAKVTIPILAVNGCAPQRTFSVRLTNTDATLAPPSEVQQAIASSTSCTFGVVAAAAATTAGSPMTFTATRSGTYLAGAQALPWTAAPGNSATTAADFSPASSTVTLPSGAASAPFTVNTTRPALDCVPEKAVTVTVTPQGGASSSATGKIAAITTGCTVNAAVTGPATPYLPADEVTVSLSEATAGRFDLASTTWTVAPLGGTPLTQLLPAAGGKGATLKLRLEGTTSSDSTRSVRVYWSVPPVAGSGGVTATGSLELDRVASYPDLVRMDGPANYVPSAATTKRWSLIWEGNDARARSWLSPDGQESTRKTLVWSYVAAGATVTVSCAHRAGEDCVFALPDRADVTSVSALVMTSPQTYRTVAEIPVKAVPASIATAWSAVRYLPVAVQVPGIFPAFFETELTLVNGSSVTAIADLTFAGVTQSEVVGAGRQVVVNGLVERLRETSPSLGNTYGPAKVVFRNLPSESDGRLVGVAARTTTPAGATSLYRRSGRAGLAYRGVARAELLGDEPGQLKAAWLIGLRGTSTSRAVSVDRTNVAAVKPDPSDAPAIVDLELYGRDGTLLRTLSIQAVQPLTQWSNVSDLAGGTEVAYARAVHRGGGPVTVYATTINNASGDGSWIFPVRQEPETATKTESLVAPVLFEYPLWGEGNFRFVADAALAAPGSAATLTRLDYFWQASGGAAAASGATSLTSSIRGQTILGSSENPAVVSKGVLESLRDGTGSAIPPQTQGQLVIGPGLLSRSDGQSFVPGTLMAGSRVDGPSSAADPTGATYGRFGIYLPAVPLRDLTNLAELRVLGLRQDGAVRSNLALINPGSTAVTLKVELQVTLADGSAASILPSTSCGSSAVQQGQVTLAARSFCQIGSVLGAVGAVSGYAVVSRSGGDAANAAKPFLAYGVVNDGASPEKGTSDGAYLVAELTGCLALGIVPQPVGVTGTSLPAASKNSPYVVELKASPSGRTYVFTATGVPAGLAVVQEGGRWYLKGTPTATGSYDVGLTAKDEAGCTGSATFSLAVADIPAEVTFTLPGGIPLVLVRVPAGTFQMGSPTLERSRGTDESLHDVTLTAGFYIGKYEVTQAQWYAVMEYNPSYFSACGGDCPVEAVSWTDVAGPGGFLERLNRLVSFGSLRLPTEAEWERAARGGVQTRFSFGDALECDDACTNCPSAAPYAWWCFNSDSITHRVGSKSPNAFGLHDMMGNVWEWLADWYGTYPTTAQTNPTGPSTGTKRVTRGGGCLDQLRYLRSADRDGASENYRGRTVGFRVAWSG